VVKEKNVFKMGFLTGPPFRYLVICRMGSIKQLLVYQKAYSQAMEIFRISKEFPKEELYSLVDQIRKSSRAVCANLAEAYRKRNYPAHFVSKVSDADSEIGRLIGDILKNPAKYL
jgi:hypothetical protein